MWTAEQCIFNFTIGKCRTNEDKTLIVQISYIAFFNNSYLEQKQITSCEKRYAYYGGLLEEVFEISLSNYSYESFELNLESSIILRICGIYEYDLQCRPLGLGLHSMGDASCSSKTRIDLTSEVRGSS